MNRVRRGASLGLACRARRLRRARSAPRARVAWACGRRRDVRLAEPNEQIGAVGVGTMLAMAVSSAPCVVGGAASVGRELLEGLIAASVDHRCSAGGPAARAQCRGELDHDVGPDSSVRCSSERAVVRASGRECRPRSAYNALARAACTNRVDRRTYPDRPGDPAPPPARSRISTFRRRPTRKPTMSMRARLGYSMPSTDARQDARTLCTARADPAHTTSRRLGVRPPSWRSAGQTQ